MRGDAPGSIQSDSTVGKGFKKGDTDVEDWAGYLWFYRIIFSGTEGGTFCLGSRAVERLGAFHRSAVHDQSGDEGAEASGEPGEDRMSSGGRSAGQDPGAKGESRIPLSGAGAADLRRTDPKRRGGDTSYPVPVAGSEARRDDGLSPGRLRGPQSEVRADLRNPAGGEERDGQAHGGTGTQPVRAVSGGVGEFTGNSSG